eukprot:m.471574 g.471574  ORF g.471574 m.471574 type:complete len:339 (+) comp31261_c0_seq1:149-1165(+)
MRSTAAVSLLRFGGTLVATQLGLDLLATVLAGAARTDGRAVRTSLSTPTSGPASTRLIRSLLLIVKRLQGHSAEHPFQYYHMGHSTAGYIVPLMCWLRVLRDCKHGRLIAAALTTAIALSGCYPLALFYTGGGGLATIHGCGLNVYYSGPARRRHFDGERFFALDWHAEKLSERGPEGRFLTRAAQRTVVWPHVHMCWLGLEFWPWTSEISQEIRDEIRQQRSQIRQARLNRRQASEESAVVDHTNLVSAISAIIGRESSSVEISRRFAAGESVRDVGLWLSDLVLDELCRAKGLPAAPAAAVRADVERAGMRAVGRQFAAWKAELRQSETVHATSRS